MFSLVDFFTCAIMNTSLRIAPCEHDSTANYFAVLDRARAD